MVNFNYKTNFVYNEARQKYVKKAMAHDKFYRNEDGVVISKEYPRNEGRDQNKKFFSYCNFCLRKPHGLP